MNTDDHDYDDDERLAMMIIEILSATTTMMKL